MDTERKAILPYQLYEQNARYLWGISYRMTGNASDAEDIVQEVFIKAIQQPPADQISDWRPWLVQVAVNLCRDLLRKRKRLGYPGPWLPSPVPTDHSEKGLYDASCEEPPSAKYELQESVTFAFLLSLEALNPTQRAVLLLRDVFDYSTKEVARVLRITETTAKVTLHRARRIMQTYAQKPKPSSAQTREALQKLIQSLQMRDMEGLERLLCDHVVVCSDGGGEVVALHTLMEGRQKALQLLTRLTDFFRGSWAIALCDLNNAPSILIDRSIEKSGHASRFTLHCEIDSEGRIHRLNFVLAPKKLTALRYLHPSPESFKI